MTNKKTSLQNFITRAALIMACISPAMADDLNTNNQTVVFSEIDGSTAERFLKSTILNNDLQSAKDEWVDTMCFGSDPSRLDKRCATKIGFSTKELLAYVSAGEPDFNNDGKNDLVLAMGSMTGLSGLGACALGEYRFYENVRGDEYRPIGKMLQVNALALKLGAVQKRGSFRDLIWQTAMECPGLDPVKETHKFNKRSNRYYDLKDIEG